MVAKDVYASKPWLSSYPSDVPAEIPEVTQTLPDMFAESLKKFGSDVALDFFGAETSYRELGDQVARVAEGLRQLGVTPGDRVAIVLPNCPQHVVAFYAALRLGAIVVEHNPLYTEPELRQQFDDHGAKVAIVWNKARAKVRAATDDGPLKHLIEVDMVEAMPRKQQVMLKLPIAKAKSAREKLTEKVVGAGSIRWATMLEHEPVAADVAGPALSDTALLQYTSGTTGTPKGAILTHANLRANAIQGEAWVPGLRKGKQTIYGVLPLFHAYGLTLCLTFAISLGARLVLFPAFEPSLVVTAMKKAPATFLPAVPPIYERLAQLAIDGKVNLHSIRFAISGAMSLPVSTVDLWERVTGGLLVEGYGMTETSPVAVGNPLGPTRRPGTVGVPFPSTAARVVDPENPTVTVPFGEPGELQLRGPQVFQGYWNKPDETAAALLGDGWLRTGDIVTMSDDGFVTIIDRLKELIITGGFNVSPTEVELALLSHPDVAEAAVVGLPTGKGGAEQVVASVVLDPGASQDVAALREYLRTHVAAYKVPKRIDFVDELPRSLIGKVLRRQVQEQMLARDAS